MNDAELTVTVKNRDGERIGRRLGADLTMSMTTTSKPHAHEPSSPFFVPLFRVSALLIQHLPLHGYAGARGGGPLLYTLGNKRVEVHKRYAL